MPYLHRQTQPTIDKCQKILRMFQEISADSIQVGRLSNVNNSSKEMSSSKTPKGSCYFISQNNAQKSIAKNNVLNKSNTKYQSTSKSNIKSISSSFCTSNPYQSISTKTFHPTPSHRQPQSLIKRQKSNSSFVSCYNRQSRLDKIMKLKVPKPHISTTKGLRSNKKMLLNGSLSSLNSSRSSLNKENINLTNYRNKESRLEKIMNIKVEKPKVNSTLIGYEPRKLQRSLSKSLSKKPLNEVNSFVQLKQVKKKQHRSEQIQQKQERLWKTFQRQRQQQQREKKKSQQQYYKQQRRQEEKFEKLVQKELRKIQNSREISLRKERAFSEYVYPAY